MKRRGYKFTSDCDCEILLPLYYEYGLDMFRHMDAEFALILYDSRKDRLIAARDPIGIRPLFYGYSKSSHKIAFASEMQNLIGWCDDIRAAGISDQRVVEGPSSGLTPPREDAALLPRGRLRGLQRRTLWLPLRERDFEAPGLQVHLRLRLRDFAAALL